MSPRWADRVVNHSYANEPPRRVRAMSFETRSMTSSMSSVTVPSAGYARRIGYLSTALPTDDIYRVDVSLSVANVGPGPLTGSRLGPLALKIAFGSTFASNTSPMKQLLISSQF